MSFTLPAWFHEMPWIVPDPGTPIIHPVYGPGFWLWPMERAPVVFERVSNVLHATHPLFDEERMRTRIDLGKHLGYLAALTRFQLQLSTLDDDFVSSVLQVSGFSPPVKLALSHDPSSITDRDRMALASGWKALLGAA